MRSPALLVLLCATWCSLWWSPTQAQEAKPGEPLAGTKPLTMEGDIAAQMVAGIDKFLLREIDLSVERRAKHWKRDFSSPEAYNKSIEPNRQRLAKLLGIVDERAKLRQALRGIREMEAKISGEAPKGCVHCPSKVCTRGRVSLQMPDECKYCDGKGSFP